MWREEWKERKQVLWEFTRAHTFYHCTHHCEQLIHLNFLLIFSYIILCRYLDGSVDWISFIHMMKKKIERKKTKNQTIFGFFGCHTEKYKAIYTTWLLFASFSFVAFFFRTYFYIRIDIIPCYFGLCMP